jgi:hypothetical protein
MMFAKTIELERLVMERVAIRSQDNELSSVASRSHGAF